MKSSRPTEVLRFVSYIPAEDIKQDRHLHSKIIATAMIIINTWWYPIIGMNPAWRINESPIVYCILVFCHLRAHF